MKLPKTNFNKISKICGALYTIQRNKLPSVLIQLNIMSERSNKKET